MNLLITGGAGFIGSAVVRMAVAQGHSVTNLDSLTYAGCLDNVAEVADNANYVFEQADINDRSELDRIFKVHEPDAVIHLAAESHVDRSIEGPKTFIETNVVGTYNLLEATRNYWQSNKQFEKCRFLHISTDEVFGTLGITGRFTEETKYDPRSPYAATKAASDHLVRAWASTYDLPVVLTNCSNNYGPFQFPEKLIPVVILRALDGEPIPIYGNGEQVRDWLHVEDHVSALLLLLQRATVGRSYNIGGENEVRNIDLVEIICSILDEERPQKVPYSKQISFVSDRPGHDKRYAVDPTRIIAEIDWAPSVTLHQGLQRTVRWYLDNEDWWRKIQTRT